MKNYLFGLLFFMAVCTPHVNDTIIIDGKVNSDAPLNVFAGTMPESACPLFLDSVALDSAGSFHIEMQSEHPVFAYRSNLSELLHEKGYESLYISIDRKDNEDKWKENIIYFGLDGSHIRANESLNKDLRKMFGANGTIYIPWYMIVNENGDVVDYHAPGPLKLDELKEIL